MKRILPLLGFVLLVYAALTFWRSRTAEEPPHGTVPAMEGKAEAVLREDARECDDRRGASREIVGVLKQRDDHGADVREKADLKDETSVPIVSADVINESTEEVIALCDSLRASALSSFAKDALCNPQCPRHPIDSWGTEVLTVARTSSDERIRSAALRVMAFNIVYRRDALATSTYLRLFEESTSDSSQRVRMVALHGLVVLWSLGHLDAARQSVKHLAETHSDEVLRELARRSLRGEPWSGQRATPVDSPQSSEWKAAIENTK